MRAPTIATDTTANHAKNPIPLDPGRLRTTQPVRNNATTPTAVAVLRQFSLVAFMRPGYGASPRKYSARSTVMRYLDRVPGECRTMLRTRR